MAARGHDVTVYTRRSDPDSPRCIVTSRGYTVVQVDAGPAKPLPETEVSHHLGKFSHSLAEQWVEEPPDVVHAHYWTSGVATELATRGTGIPTVQTFHELGAARTGSWAGATPTQPRGRNWRDWSHGTPHGSLRRTPTSCRS